jgi:hypothetical protein
MTNSQLFNKAKHSIMYRFLFVLLIMFVGTASGYAQNFKIRKVVVSDLLIAIQMQCTNGAVCPVSGGCDDFDFLTDLIFTLKSTMADAPADINETQVDCGAAGYSIDDEVAISNFPPYYLHGFSCELTPTGFPASWAEDTWVTICTLDVAADLDPNEITIVSFDEAEQLFAPGDEPNIGINFDDYVPEVEDVLPLDLLSFKAQKHQEYSAILNWSTVNEVNTSHFVAERSMDRLNWTEVGKVQAKANGSTSILQYELVDQDVYDGRKPNARFYYRLQIIDHDGRLQKSNIEIVQFSSDVLVATVFVFPNPSTEGVSVELNYNEETAQPADIVLYNDLGQMVYQQEIAEGSALEYIDFTKSDITSGTYTLQVMDQTNGILTTEKLVVQR